MTGGHYDLLTALERIDRIKTYDMMFLEDAVERYGEESEQALREKANLFSDELQLRYLSLHAAEAEDRSGSHACRRNIQATLWNVSR